MSDPRWNIEDQPERQLNTHRQPSRASSDNFLPTQVETNRRREFEENITQSVPGPEFATPQPSAPVSPPPSAPGPDRLHKWGSHYVVVSNDHKPSPSDPVPNPGYRSAAASFSSIMDAYNYAVSSLVPSISASERVSVVILGGYYPELCTFNNSRVDVYGVGMPIVTAPPFGSFTNPVITISASAAKCHIDGLEVINIGGEGYNWWTNAGLVIETGTESGTLRSDIWITNCYFHGSGTQIYSQRWAHFEHCHIYSEDNIFNGWGYAAAVVRYGTAQARWTHFVNCFISGQSDLVYGSKIKRGQALAVLALQSDRGTWVDNTLTIGPDIYYAKTGVILQNCEIVGWAENKGWALEYFDCQIIEGKWINDAGAGSVHLTQYSRTNNGGVGGIDSFTWFTGGMAKVNYLVQYSDANVVDVSVTSVWVWIKNYTHSAPTNVGASVVIVFGAQQPVGKVWGLASTTSKQFFLNGPPEAALIINCNTAVPNTFNREGYINI